MVKDKVSRYEVKDEVSIYEVKDEVSRYEVKDEVSIYEVKKLYTHHKLDFPDPYIFATWWWTVNFKELRATCTMYG